MMIVEYDSSGTYRTDFWTPFADERDRLGQPFEVVGVTEQGECAGENDDEFVPTYRIRFADGHEIDAYGEEVYPHTAECKCGLPCGKESAP